MTNEALEIFGALVNSIWVLFTSWHVPGTNFTPAQFYLFLLLLPLIIKLVKSIVTVSLDMLSTPKGGRE